MDLAYFLFIIHRPISVACQRGENEEKQLKTTNILLLLPVPKSIIMCLLLFVSPGKKKLIGNVMPELSHKRTDKRT